jgi:plasmid replication initiation protein
VLLGAMLNMAKLLKRKHPQQDFFICDVLDATPKDDIGSMEHPFFSLSKKPDHKIRYYEHNGEYIKIAPGAYGMATIFDKDILIFAMSQIIAKMNAGEEPSQIIRFSAYDLLVSTERDVHGRSYERLKAALARLQGTSITTCIRTGTKEITKGFGLIEWWDIIRETRDGRMEGLELKISDWLYNAILEKEVLTISRDYFRLGKPIERRIYEICRKHCGKQKTWSIGLELLKKKTGSKSPIRNFRIDVKKAIENNDFPDYKLSLEDDLLSVRPRARPALVTDPKKPKLKPQTIENAKKILGNDFDVYAVESDWLHFWEMSGRPELKTPDGAFINFCKKQLEKHLEQ